MVRDVNFSGTFKGMQSNSANEGKKEGISAALCFFLVLVLGTNNAPILQHTLDLVFSAMYVEIPSKPELYDFQKSHGTAP